MDVELIFPSIVFTMLGFVIGMGLTIYANSRAEGCPCKVDSDLPPKCDIGYNCCSSKRKIR